MWCHLCTVLLDQGRINSACIIRHAVCVSRSSTFGKHMNERTNERMNVSSRILLQLACCLSVWPSYKVLALLLAPTCPVLLFTVESAPPATCKRVEPIEDKWSGHGGVNAPNYNPYEAICSRLYIHWKSVRLMKTCHALKHTGALNIRLLLLLLQSLMDDKTHHHLWQQIRPGQSVSRDIKLKRVGS